MESTSRRRPSSLSMSAAKMMAWLPRLSALSSLSDEPEPTIAEPLNAPGSLQDAHNAAGAWFLGPKAENINHFKKYVDIILNDLTQCRRDFAPQDEDFVTSKMASSTAFKGSMSRLETNLTFLSALLPQHSVPFYSPRYMAHMLNDVSMPATLGYLLALMYNPNNVAQEGGPLTNVIEYDVGQQLCSMLGYDVQPGGESSFPSPTAWGHITCDGSVANMESMWVARNLKFYPLSLKRAVDNESCLAYVATNFKVRLCTGKQKALADCDSWDLLNLTPDEVVSLATRVSDEFGLSTQALQAIMSDYIIQTTGKDDLENYFGIQRPPQYLCSKTTHYSWPKGAAITGIGSRNMIGVPVDDQARMDCQALDMLLAECVKHRQAIYAVVAIMGTTEHGTVDPLSKILALRRKYQRRGLSFLVHADAAWGGYFTSMLVPNPDAPEGENPLDDPTLFLSPYAENELRHLRLADSITIDPHKSGYAPYPAGALCYRDGRLRYMVTWTSPVIGSMEEGAAKMGVYGVEGSKTGAAPVAAWLGHEVIGLHKGGFGFLLGESVFTSIKMYGHWATMSLDHPNLLVVPFRMLPSEMNSDASAQEVDEERRFIRDVILKRTREELANDPRACALMRQMGSDLVVNAFACNFRINGVANKDISEANYLNARLYDRLSFKKMTERLNDQKVIIMSSVFSQKEYGVCLTNFKERLGLTGDEDLFVLVNVSMSPFASPISFEQVLAADFREVAEEEVKISLKRNKSVPALRAFVLQGNGPISLVHMPCFSTMSQRRQCILNGELSGTDLMAYLEAKREDPTATYVACAVEGEELSAIIQRKSFSCLISKLTAAGTSAIMQAQITNITVIKNRQLSSRYLDAAYPGKMPFYLYGTRQEIHLDHMLLHAPNAQLSAGDVTVELKDGDESVFAAGLKKGLIAVADALPERLMQPFTVNRRPQFFRPGAQLDVSIYHDRRTAQSQGPGLCDRLGEPIAHATITLGNSVFVDSFMINVDTPIIASHVPKKRAITLPSAEDASSQDHPLFRGYGLAGHADGAAHSTNPSQWREIWDNALAARRFSDIPSRTATPPESTASDTDSDDYCPSPIAVRRPRVSFFAT
ncbi:pyridoxal phosphate-dependent transferase [Gloeopeniophorella convolvens]|nr:pyridoxal phosphate-dependent transferase [Gloeopeniophorella convolvens]